MRLIECGYHLYYWKVGKGDANQIVIAAAISTTAIRDDALLDLM